MTISDKDLAKLLLENQVLKKSEILSSIRLAKSKKITLYEVILRKDLLSDENVGILMADYLKLPFINLLKVAIPSEVLRIIPQKLAEEKRVIAFELQKDEIHIATSDPDQEDLFSMIAQKSGTSFKLYFATERGIEEALSLYKKSLEGAFDKLMTGTKSAGGEFPVSEILDKLIENAYDNKASDIHIEPEEEKSLVRFRIDGVLHDALDLPKTLHDQIITRIKVLSKLRTDEHLSSQDGKMRVKLTGEELDIRVSIVPIVGGEKTVLRLLTSHFRQFGLLDLGMKEADLQKVKSGFNKPYGMVLSTGPTGSGKTTSMYSILKILNTRERNIATIEDPVEYEIEGISQIQVNPKTNLTFAGGLRSILRQDPDIIYVGEIRDDETADIAINSAMTGHLVLSTLHTNDAATSLPRLIDMGIEPFLVASSVNVIIGQRLVRKICERCKVSYTLKFEEISKTMGEEFAIKYFNQRGEVRLFKGKGCDVCHKSGYTGRIGVFEVLLMSEKIQVLITAKADSDSIERQAILEGMTTMLEDGLSKALEGLTSIEEVLRATKE